MERRKALAAATAATFILGSGIVAAASVTGASFLGFGGGAKHDSSAASTSASGKPGVIVKTRNIYDQFVVATDDGTTGAAAANWNAVASGGSTETTVVSEPTTPGPGHEPAPDDSTPTTNAPSSRPAKGGTTPTTRDATTPTTEAPDGATPPTTAPSPTTVPTTTTTWPLGVPKDWPKNTPIPPMPPNCQKPQLEDNGVWNCDH